MALLRCRRDPCGFICLILTYFSVFYADYVVLQYVLIPTFTGSVWCKLHGSVFNVVLLLLLACHSKAVFSDPGLVPLPERAIDFSDLRSQSSRMNDRLVSIITDETPIEQMRNRLLKDRVTGGQSVHTTHTRKPKVALLREVFGRGSVLCWFLPFQSSTPSAGGISYSPVPDYNV
ncbi:Palmitoyltransferase ZDHHC3 [Bagarius yarrelli]|uniref:Palmitoyltransferase ZDHHC3 n=1 Tax=Bagarius yarrelli TaxID=175774 RepID=A0A556VXF0_BAGYA|nr:Palmitoyltransferase ZDHHC3 [Bagarius yarrelli]